MTGWRRLITATVRLAHRDGTRLRRRPADGRLLFEPVGETTNRSAEYSRGLVAAAWTLSAEICQACGGPGDPVTLGSGGRGTRCTDCREPGDRVLPRPPWRREREPGERRGLLEDLVGTEDLAHLMEARNTPPRYGAWPAGRAEGDDGMRTVCPIGGRGWNHILRAGLQVLLPLECPGSGAPWRTGQIKERMGHLVVYHWPHTQFGQGVSDLLSNISGTTCIHCGQPGRLRMPGWVHPACAHCWPQTRWKPPPLFL